MNRSEELMAALFGGLHEEVQVLDVGEAFVGVGVALAGVHHLRGLIDAHRRGLPRG